MWGQELAQRLKGDAEAVIDCLEDDELKRYDVVKEALLKAFQLTSDAYRRRFLSCRKLEKETFRQTVARMKHLFARWLELASCREDFKELRELLYLEQLYRSVGEDVARYVREKKPKTVNDAADLAEAYMENQRSFRGRQKHGKPASGPTPNNSHRGANQSSPSRAPMKTPDGKTAEAGPQRSVGYGGPRRSSLAQVQCHHCYDYGHYKRSCPVLQASVKIVQGRGSDGETLCEGKVNGNVTVVLRDTGADLSIVDPKFVDETAQPLRTVVVRGLYVRQDRPVHHVTIDTPYWTGTIEAAVVPLDGLGCGFILGNRVCTVDGRKVAMRLPGQVPTPSEPLKVAVTTRAQSKRETDGDRPLRVTDAGLGGIDFYAAQTKDRSLDKFFKMADAGKQYASGQKGTVRFTTKAGYLYREYETPEGKYRQLVVPTSLRENLLRLAHDTPMAGHLGTKKTLDRLWRHFYWPGICSTVRRWCASCERCQKTEPRGRTQKVPLGRMPLVEEPFRRVAADLIGPIEPASDRKHRFILVVVDFATRYPEAVPLKSIDTTTVAEALWTMWTRVGIPQEILTDNGGQFVSGTMDEVNRLLCLKGLRTTPFHAQCNGLCERYNGTLKQMLRRLCGDRPRDWDRYIPALLFAYREVPTESLGYSPFELLYGHSVRGPMQVLRELWTSNTMPEDVRTPSEYVLNLRERISDVCEIATENLAAARDRYAGTFNKKTKNRQFEVGTRVLLLLPTKHNKLEMEWRGPYPVVERVGAYDYRIDVDGKIRMYHANMLKAYVEREALRVGVAVVVDDPDEGEEVPTFPVEGKETFTDVHIDSLLETEQKKDLEGICQSFRKTLTDLPGLTDIAEFTIEMSDSKPVFVRPYPVPYSQVDTVKKEVDTMLKLGVIERASSPYNSPIVLVKKPDDTYRFCTDFRRCNAKVVFDGEPLPDPELLFAKVAKARYFSKIDLSKGYWQVPIRPEDKPKTAFSTPQGQFQWTVMPFGVSTAVAVFSRMMRRLLEPLERDDIHNFMDDCLVATETWEEHVEALKVLFGRLQEVNLTARPSKCFLGFRELNYLGHRVGHGCVWPEPDKVDQMRNARRPETKKELRSTLGTFGYYRKFIPSFSSIALPLTERTKKNMPTKIEWTEDCERAFQTLKERLCSSPILKLPDVSQPFVLRTDADGKQVGATLFQEHEGELFPCAYASKKLNPAEKNYATVERECLAIVWGIRKFESFLYGRKFTLDTDHSSLRYLHSAKLANSRLMRWALLLQAFQFHVRSIPGSENLCADYLSRFGE